MMRYPSIIVFSMLAACATSPMSPGSGGGGGGKGDDPGSGNTAPEGADVFKQRMTELATASTASPMTCDFALASGPVATSVATTLSVIDAEREDALPEEFEYSLNGSDASGQPLKDYGSVVFYGTFEWKLLGDLAAVNGKTEYMIEGIFLDDLVVTYTDQPKTDTMSFKQWYAGQVMRSATCQTYTFPASGS
jgi:hypothetical protein